MKPHCLLLVVFAHLPLAAMPLAAASPPAAIAPAVRAEPAAEIDALLSRVAAAKGVVFIRNGSRHTPAEAARHLRRKLDAAAGRVRTPEQLIEHLGSRSSISGQAYRVRFADGREIDSAVWLRGLLAEVRHLSSVKSPPAR